MEVNTSETVRGEYGRSGQSRANRLLRENAVCLLPWLFQHVQLTFQLFKTFSFSSFLYWCCRLSWRSAEVTSDFKLPHCPQLSKFSLPSSRWHLHEWSPHIYAPSDWPDKLMCSTWTRGSSDCFTERTLLYNLLCCLNSDLHLYRSKIEDFLSCVGRSHCVRHVSMCVAVKTSCESVFVIMFSVPAESTIDPSSGGAVRYQCSLQDDPRLNLVSWPCCCVSGSAAQWATPTRSAELWPRTARELWQRHLTFNYVWLLVVSQFIQDSSVSNVWLRVPDCVHHQVLTTPLEV